MATPVSLSTTLTNSDGSPLNGVLVNVFNAGVDQLATLYSNSSGTSLANPVTSSASGVVTFFAQPGTYTLNGYDNHNDEFQTDVTVAANASGAFGANNAVTAAATTVAVTLSSAQADTNYSVQATPSWGSTVFVTAKTTGGFTLNFGTAAPAGATVDWALDH